jgi:hypothetical protein
VWNAGETSLASQPTQNALMAIAAIEPRGIECRKPWASGHLRCRSGGREVLWRAHPSYAGSLGQYLEYLQPMLICRLHTDGMVVVPSGLVMVCIDRPCCWRASRTTLFISKQVSHST